MNGMAGEVRWFSLHLLSLVTLSSFAEEMSLEVM